MEANQPTQAPQPAPLTGPEAVAQWRAARAENQQQQEAVEQAPAEEPAVEDTIVEEPDEVDQSQDEVAADVPDQEDVEDISDDEEVEEYLTSENLTDVETLAEALNIDVNELLDQLTVETKVVGKLGRMSIAEMRVEAQKGLNNDRIKAELQEERTQMREARAKQDDEWQKSLAYMGHVLNQYDQVNNSLSEDFLDEVRSQLGDDAYRVINKVRRQLIGAQDHAVKTYNKQIQNSEAENKVRMQEAVQETIRGTINLMPDMADNAKAQKVFDNVREYLVGRAGFSPQEAAQFANNPFDPRALQIFRDAAEAWGNKKAEKVVKRKIKNIPRMRKKSSGTEKSPEVRKAKASSALSDLVSTASANPSNSRLKKDAGMAVIANMRARRGA